MAQTDWMKAYKDRTLGELHMPGSHDAGITGGYIEKTFGGTDKNSITQDLTIPEQLAAGTRFFDLRLKEHNKQVVAHHTTAGLGAYSSTPVDDVLADAAKFCLAHTSEVVIFRISHTKLKTKAEEIVKASGKGALHTGKGSLCAKTLEEIASDGGLVCIFDSEAFGSVINQRAGIHSFTKYKGAPDKAGISCCGCYKGSNALKSVVCTGLKGQYEHNTKHNPINHDHLWQLYWQKTYKNPFHSGGISTGTKKDAFYIEYGDGSSKLTGGTHCATKYMIKLMNGLGKVGKEDLKFKVETGEKGLFGTKKKKEVIYSTLAFRNFSLPNIISYDFVNEETNKIIIAMNNKSLQKADDDSDEDMSL